MRGRRDHRHHDAWRDSRRTRLFSRSLSLPPHSSPLRPLHFRSCAPGFQMPELNGRELLLRMRALGVRFPIVLLAGDVDALSHEDRVLFARCIEKCMPIQHLLKTIEEFWIQIKYLTSACDGKGEPHDDTSNKMSTTYDRNYDTRHNPDRYRVGHIPLAQARRSSFMAWAITSLYLRPAPVLKSTTRSDDERNPVERR